MTELASAGPTTARGAPFRARLPYTQGPDGLLRPYVVLDVTGPNAHPIRVSGLIDTGADDTSMPDSFIDLFGYGDEDLELRVVASPGGTLEVRSVLLPLRASLPGESNTALSDAALANTAFELRPIFVPGLFQVLLGRRDFMSVFAVSIVEESQEFSLFKRH